MESIQFNIKDLIGEDFLKRFKLVFRETLFEPNWEALKVNRCPICGNKLKFPKAKIMAYCNGRKHQKSFVIMLKRLEKIQGTDYKEINDKNPWK